MNLSDKTCLLFDRGIFCSWSEKLSEIFGRTFLYVPYKSQFPTSTSTRIGYGLKNVERICGLDPDNPRDFWDVVDEEAIDLFLFLDTGDADIQAQLGRMGRRVWGSGRADDLELFRADTKRLLEKIGLPQQPWEEVVGVDALRKSLYEKKNCVWVKISGNRGDSETFEYDPDDPESTETELKGLEYRLGTVMKEMRFTFEDEIYPAVEIGYDGISVDGEYPPESLLGIEKKDEAYFGAVVGYDDLPEQVREVNDKLAPILRKYECRNFFSTAIRLPEDLTPYVVDLTMRAGSPPSEVYQEAVENWGEVFWYGAEGIIVPLKFKAKYSCLAIIHCDYAATTAQTVRFPEEIAPFIKLKNYHIVDGLREVLPQPVPLKEIGSVVAISDDPLEAIRIVQERSKLIKPGDCIAKVDMLPKAIAEFRKGEEFGLDFGGLQLPDETELVKAIA